MDRLNWNDINVFLALYRGRSVRAAATQLNMSHSTEHQEVNLEPPVPKVRNSLPEREGPTEHIGRDEPTER